MAKKKSPPPGEGPAEQPEKPPGRSPKKKGASGPSGSSPKPKPRSKPKAKPKAGQVRPETGSGPRTKRKGRPDSPPREFAERILRNFVAPPDRAPSTPLERAQALVTRAENEPDPEEQARLAHEALAIEPDCADAYDLLSDLAPTRAEALELAEKAVATAERALGPEAFREYEGHFWGVWETRPYMRARQTLANRLWEMGRREEAAEHLRSMLRLNPNDNQGLRYVLAEWLLSLDRDDELAELLHRYEHDASATWAYTRALLAFRREGDTPPARKLLKAARMANKFVPAYLLRERPLPIEPPEYYRMGFEDEAILYVAAALTSWRTTPGAITWLRTVLKPRRKPRSKAPAAIGPSDAAKARLRRLPQEPVAWQADARAVATLIQDAGELVQPWMLLVASPEAGLILGQSLATERPSPARAWDLLAAAMESPLAGSPHRPTRVEIPPGPPWDELASHLDELGIASEPTEQREVMDFLYDDLTRHLTRDEPPGLLEMPGVTPEHVAGFYAAAAAFYRRAPWRFTGSEEAIRVACDRFESGPWYAVIMGQSGLTLGLALYEDIDLLRQMWAGTISEQENVRQTVALSVTFDEAEDLRPADLLAARRYAWEVAGPESYPTAFRKERGLSMRPPLAWELELLEACLRALPEFAARHPRSDTREERVTVPLASGQLDLILSWVEES